MKITLIYAAVGIAGFNPNRLPGDREGSWISHGLASLATVTRNAGFEVDLIDLRQLSGWEDFSTRIQANPAEIYGIQASPVDHFGALKTIYEIKMAVPQAKIVIGGILPTLFPEKFSYEVVDTVFLGEGEITFPKILQDYANGIPLPKQIRGEKPDLATIPWIDREFFDYRREMTCNWAPDHPLPSVSMLSGRGCPFKCAFCQPAENSVFGKPFRMRPVQDVIDELYWLYEKYRFRSVNFWDDTFTVNRRWVKEFCDKFDLPVKISILSRADIICKNEDMIERLAGIGVDWIATGFETGSQRLLDLIHKGTTIEQNYRAVEIMRKYGIKVFAAFMYGLPTETPEESLMTERMIDDLAPEHPCAYWYTPIPGTNLYNYCKDNDLLLHDMDEESIERTAKFSPQIKGVDYKVLEDILDRHDHYAYGSSHRAKLIRLRQQYDSKCEAFLS